MSRPISQNFKELINEGKFRVPGFQRKYVWKKGTQIEEFWEDFNEYYQAKRNGDNAQLYLGTLILLKSDDGYLDIIDGQQRVTTLFIFMVALKKFLDDKIQEGVETDVNLTKLRSDLDKKIGFYDSNTGVFSGPRLIASSKIQETIADICDQSWDYTFKVKIGDKKIKNQVNAVKPIYEYFYQKISSVEASDIKFLMSSLHELEFITIEVDSIEEAYDLFERTNARGAALEVSDLLKNKLFAQVSGGNTDIIASWDEITSNAGTNLIRMLKYFYVSRRGYITRSRLYKELKSYAENDYEKLLKELTVFSEYYNVYNNYKNHQDIKDVLGLGLVRTSDRQYHIYQSLNGLDLIGVTQAVPLFFSILYGYREAGLDDIDKHKDTLSCVFRDIENYHFINNFICNRVGNEVEKLYAEYASLFYKSKTDTDFSNNLDGLYTKLREQLAKKDEFVSKFKDLQYSPSNTRVFLYIFDRFNTAIKLNKIVQSEGNAPKIYKKTLTAKTDSFNIEHWFPQTPGESLDEEFEDFHHNIGNLLVIPPKLNSKLQNKSPLEKYEILKADRHENTLKHNMDFIKNYDVTSSWDEGKIEARSCQLAEEAYSKFWKFDPKRYT